MDTMRMQGNPGMQKSRPPQQPASVQPPGPDPFPPIRVEEKNPRYAYLLKIDMASAKGEFTAISRYIYQSWTLAQADPEKAVNMHRFAMDEMHHLDILGKLVVLLGGNPGFAVPQRNRVMVWNGSMVNYTRDTVQAVRDDLAGEMETIERYNEQLAIIRDENINALLRRILEDEQRHKKLLENYLG